MKKLLPLCIIFFICIACNDTNTVDYKSFKEAQDHSVPLFNTTEANKAALFVFPHPDDEITCAGTIAQLKEKGWRVNLLTLTKGQPDVEGLTDELKNAGTVLGLDDHEILDLPNNSWDTVLDNTIDFWNENTDSIENIIYKSILKHKPSLLFTYDTALADMATRNTEYRQ